MASVIDDPNGRRRIQFNPPNAKRKTIHLGKIDRKSADAIARHVEDLVAAKISGQPVPARTATWVAEIGDKLRKKLTKVGLVEGKDPAKVLTIGALVAEYLAARTDVKQGTAINLDQAGRALVAALGKDRAVSSVTEADAENFARKLIDGGLATNTARRRIG
jgi:hypothetical protein